MMFLMFPVIYIVQSCPIRWLGIVPREIRRIGEILSRRSGVELSPPYPSFKAYIDLLNL